MKKILSDALTAVLVASALIVAGVVLHREIRGTQVRPSQPVALANWEALTASSHVIGAAGAPVKVVEFFDYQCPYCRSLQPALAELRERYPGEVAIIYRHFPLERHPLARSAALAATCAATQNRFEPYHNLLFENPDRLEAANWEHIAEAVDIPDLEAFRECIEQQDTAPLIDADVLTAKMLKIRGTPTLFINGVLVSGAVSIEELDALVQGAFQEE